MSVIERGGEGVNSQETRIKVGSLLLRLFPRKLSQAVRPKFANFPIVFPTEECLAIHADEVQVSGNCDTSPSYHPSSDRHADPSLAKKLIQFPTSDQYTIHPASLGFGLLMSVRALCGWVGVAGKSSIKVCPRC